MPVDNSIALQTKVPDGMASLGSMLNIARGAQEYGQAQQMNPILLQAAQQEADYAKLKNPELVSQAQEATKQSQFSTKQGYQKAIDQGLSALSQDPVILDATDPNAMVKSIMKQQQMLVRAGVPEDQAMIGASHLIAAATTDPKSVVNLLATARRNQISSSQQQSNITGAQTLQGFNTAGAGILSNQNPATGAVNVQSAPMPGQPQASPVSPPLNPQQAPIAQPTGVTPTQMNMSPEAAALAKPVPLPYPTRNPNQVYAQMPAEKADTESGISYKNSLISGQTGMSTARRNLQEVMSSSDKIEQDMNVLGIPLGSAGFLGSVNRNTNQFFGTESGIELKRLNKDLANVAISNMRTLGSSLETDSGKQLVRMANGDETYPPSILKEIAQRTNADLTNIDMQATAAAKFAQQYGDNNMNAFKQAWSKNADSKVFQARNIFDGDGSPQEKKEAIDKLTIGRIVTPDKPMTKEESKKRNTFLDKWNNISKLVNNGSL